MKEADLFFIIGFGFWKQAAIPVKKMWAILLTTILR